MKLTDARALAHEIQATGPACTVPYGYGPDGYFARIWTARGCVSGRRPVDFIDRKGWDVWREWWATQDAEEGKALAVLPKKRSTLDILIDRACGIEAKP